MISLISDCLLILQQLYNHSLPEITMRVRNQRNNGNSIEQAKLNSRLIQQRNRAKVDFLSVPSDYMSLEFKYSFQDYLKMALCKMVPQQGILFNQREGFIYGPREECIKLKKKVQKELTSRKYKKIEFKKEADLDEIDYELDCKFQARIFRCGFIERALAAIQQFDGLETPCNKFKRAISDGKTIILKVKSDFEDECMEKIDKILKRSSSAKGKLNHQREEEQQQQEVVEQEANYYQMMQAEKNEEAQCEKMLEELNESKICSQPESSFTLTQTDSSQLMEEQSDSIIIEQAAKVSKSFM